MQKPRCKTCYFFDAEFRACKIRAPVALIVPIDAPPKFQAVTAYPQPPKGENDWCGEHVPESMGLIRH